MAEIYRDVEIKPPEISEAKLRIKGKRGGEMKISLIKENGINPRNKVLPLLIDCYRTREIHSFDVSNYNGNKGEIIRVGVNGDNHDYIKGIMLYIISPDRRLIEYGKMKRNNRYGSKRALFEYKTKISHQFKEVNVICCEEFCCDIE